MASAPLLGSPLLFPRRFDAAAQRLLLDPTGPGVAPSHARWYFGAALKLDVHPAILKRRISDFVYDHSGVRWMGISFVDGADWSPALAPLIGSPVHREIGELIEANLDFRRIRSYRAQLRAAQAGRPVRRNGLVLAGEPEIEGYYRYCVALIDSIRRSGLQRRRAVDVLKKARVQGHGARPPKLDRVERDIGIAVNENGELVRHLAGKHRTAIAQAIGLRSIPVEVRLVHVRWLARQVEETGLPPHLALRHALARLRQENAGTEAGS